MGVPPKPRGLTTFESSCIYSDNVLKGEMKYKGRTREEHGIARRLMAE